MRLAATEVATSALNSHQPVIVVSGERPYRPVRILDHVRALHHSGMRRNRNAGLAAASGAVTDQDESLASRTPAAAGRPLLFSDPIDPHLLGHGQEAKASGLLPRFDRLGSQPALLALLAARAFRTDAAGDAWGDRHDSTITKTPAPPNILGGTGVFTVSNDQMASSSGTSSSTSSSSGNSASCWTVAPATGML